MVEKASIGNLKQTWTSRGLTYDLADAERFGGDYFLRRATRSRTSGSLTGREAGALHARSGGRGPRRNPPQARQHPVARALIATA